VPSQRPTPLVRIRVIGPANDAERILAHLAEHVMPSMFGPHVICRSQRRAAHPAGHVRAYCTVTPRGES
jgi:hypothetical protein